MKEQKKSLKIEYLDEENLLIILREGADSNTLNFTSSRNKHFVIRCDQHYPQAVGYFISAANFLLPKVIKALNNPNQVECVKEYFEKSLDDATEALQKAIQAVLQQQSEEIVDHDFVTSTS